jgi:aerobic carbon-monoxide dehydrogenase medium subunit
MLLREVEYVRPSSVDEAVRLLADNPGARPLAGGQTLLNVMKQRLASPDLLVDLGRVSELDAIGRSADGGLAIGAMVTTARLIESPEVQAARPILGEVAATIADVQVRNRGTIGGNVCVNDPTNHLPPLLVAVGATMIVRGAGGERSIPAEDFFVGVYETAAGEGDLLTRIDVAPAGPGTGDAMEGTTLGRHGTFIACAAASVSDGAWRVVLGCVDAVPVRARQLEERLGADPGDDEVQAAAEGLGASVDPPSDVHASADYRRHLAEVAAVRAVRAAARRARG